MTLSEALALKGVPQATIAAALAMTPKHTHVIIGVNGEASLITSDKLVSTLNHNKELIEDGQVSVHKLTKPFYR